MKAIDISIYEYMKGMRQYRIPDYQRVYSWGKEDCQNLWDDIVSSSQDKKEHFIGSIVQTDEKSSTEEFKKAEIIDGQQRLITLTCVLIALRDFISGKDKKNGIVDEIKKTFFINPDKSGEDRYKLISSKTDREDIFKLIDNLCNPDKQSRIYDNYDFFKEKIEEANLSPSEICEAIKNLRIVKIDIYKDDNPQLIFERLNSTGKDLKASDLIRNYFLMKADKEGEKDACDIWAQIEELFISKDKGASMDDFFLYYLTIKNGKSPRRKDVYKEFQDYGKSQDCMFLCEDIRCFAECYYDICFPADENPLKSVYEHMKMIDVDSYYPFLLNVYYDCYEKNKITEEIVEEITSICISYALRSIICESNTRTFGDTFNEIMRKIKEMSEIKGTDYLDLVKKFFLSLKEGKEFPTDETFLERFETKDIPKKLQKYILFELEERGFDYKHKEIGSLGTMTTEHIIPQTLTPEWESALGGNWEDIHKNYLNVIGNLTLTGYNPNMQNYSFAEKLKIGFKNSPLQLNKYVADQTKWTQEQVKERAALLAEKAKEIWSYPSLKKQPIIERKQREQELTLESYEWNARSKELFENVDAKILNLSLDGIIKRKHKQQYIAYEVNDAGFVHIVPRKTKGGIILRVNIKFEDINPTSICKNITPIRTWGKAEMILDSLDKSDEIMAIVKQAFEAAGRAL